MVETTHRPADTSPVQRFPRPARWVHGCVGVLMVVCILTAAVLYNGSLEVLVGRRYTVELVHVVSGFALPVPLLVGLLFPSYRADLRRLNRFAPRDWAWLRSRNRRDGSIPVGKFNAGQKLNAALSGGSILVLLVSGFVMWVVQLTPLSWRSGATFVHDWFSLGLGLLVLGHVLFALRDPIAMRGMRTGSVPLRWARRHHGAWADEVAGPQEPGVSPGRAAAPAPR